MRARARRVLLAVLLALALFWGGVSNANASLLGTWWTHTAGKYPTVYIEDRTGSAWPVLAAAQEWARGYQYRPCDSTHHCVRVVEGYSTASWGATTAYASDAQHHFYGIPKITVNDRFTYLSWAQRKDIVKHELGHTLGLGHDGYTDVMNCCKLYSYISAYEVNELHYIYGIT